MGRARAFVVLALAGALAVTGVAHEASACSCVGPQLGLTVPVPATDAPLLTRVRIALPDPARAGVNGAVVLRKHGGATVATTTRTFADGRWVATVEIVPTAPLAPDTTYEVAVVEPDAHPSTTVVTGFTTGKALDTTAPQLDALGAATVHRNARAMSSMCQTAGPWVTIEGVDAHDPSRPDASLVFGVWLADANGVIDAKKPPTALRTAHQRMLVIGQQSICDPYSFPFPRGGVVWLGVAAIDESGNTSAMRRVRIDLGAPTAAQAHP
ncbi:MAG: hypothetical protein JST00_25200 [Deltaproteobacteria bacterium]|nr:hypothetical protein [Deltaproteobacteria bacterium]